MASSPMASTHPTAPLSPEAPPKLISVESELVLFGLLVAVAGLAVLARLVRVPYPILLVLGGLGIGLVPGAPEVELDPDIVLLIFLPPLLYAAAFFSNLRELRSNAGPIALLAIGLVIATMLAVAAVGHWVIGLDWRSRSCSARWSPPPTPSPPGRSCAGSGSHGG